MKKHLRSPPIIKLNERDRLLLRALEESGCLDVPKLARLVGMTQRTIRNRMEQLSELGAIRSMTLVKPEFSAYPVRAMVSIHLESRNFHPRQREYSNQHTFCDYLRSGLTLPQQFRGAIRIESASLVMGGSCDMVVFVAAASPDIICRFVTAVLREFTCVRETNTAMIF